MPGYSEYCVSGAHEACIEKTCYCQCHSWTQELLRQQAGKRAAIKAGSVAVEPSGEIAELRNVCPSCGLKARTSDSFCRKDGSRLLQGKQCLNCQAPGEPNDVHCWNCGIKLGEKPVPAMPVDEQSQEDPITRIKRKAIDQGLLQETVVK